MHLLSLSGMAIAIASLFSFLFVILNNPRRQINITWSLLCLSVALWGIGVFFGFRTNIRDEALFWGRALNLVALFIPLFFIHFTYSYLGTGPKNKNFIFGDYVVTLSYFVISLLFPAFFIKAVLKQPHFLFYPNAGFLFYLSPVLFSVNVGMGIIALWDKYKNSSGVLKNQMKYLLWGVAIGFAGGATTFPLVFNIKIYPFGTPLIIFYVIFSTYAMTRYRLFDIEIIIKKTAVYSILTALLTAIFVSLILISQWFFSGLTGYSSIFATVLGVFILSFLSQPLRDKIQALVDKLFFKSKYDYSQELSKISSQITSNLSLENILQTLQRAFSDVMKVSPSQIYLPKDFEQSEVKAFLSLKEATMREENLMDNKSTGEAGGGAWGGAPHIILSTNEVGGSMKNQRDDDTSAEKQMKLWK